MRAATDRVSSVEPSSTTMISASGVAARRRAPTQSRRSPGLLWTGTMTEMPGSGEALPRLGPALEVLRVEGVRSFWFKVLGQIVYRRLVVMERPLDEAIVPVTARAPVVIGLLTDADVDEYTTFRPDTDPAEIRRRLVAGHRCFVVRHEGRIVHAGWAARREAWIDYLRCEFPLEPGDVYQFDSYTAPAF